MDTITLDIDGAEAHVLEAALAIYRGELDAMRHLGGPALDAAVTMDPIARRVQAKLHDALYGSGEPLEPDWTMPESADPLTRAKATRIAEWADLSLGDHYVGMPR
jgi:hypothetical protein